MHNIIIKIFIDFLKTKCRKLLETLSFWLKNGFKPAFGCTPRHGYASVCGVPPLSGLIKIGCFFCFLIEFIQVILYLIVKKTFNFFN
jgi:hypothetical protein